MSTYDREIESRVRRNSLFALGIIKQLEKDYNLKIDDNHKAHLIGQLSLAASLESLTVYANKVSKSFAFEFFQEMIKKGVVAALTPVPIESPKEPEPILTEKETIVAPLIEDQSPPEKEKPESPEEESKSAPEELTPSEPISTTTTDKPEKTKAASKPSKRKKKTKKASTPKTQPK